MADSTNLESKIAINVDASKARSEIGKFESSFSRSMAELGKSKTEIKGIRDLAREIEKGTRSTDELDRETKELVTTYQRLKQQASDRDLLGVKNHQKIREEIKNVKLAYERLKASGTLSNRELQQASEQTRARVAQLRGELGKTASSGFVDSLNRMKYGLLAVGAAIATAVAKVGKWIDASNVQERAEVKLATTLKSLTGATDEQIQALKAQASALQNVTGYGDETTLSAQAMLGTFQLTAEQIGQLTPKMLDMAESARKAGSANVDLESISIALGKAFTSGIGSLSRYGVALTDAQKEGFDLADQQGKVNILTEVLADNFDGLAAAVGQTYEGAVRKASAASGDLDEVIGKQISSNKSVISLTNLLTNAYNDMGKGINDASGEIGEAIGFMANVIKGSFGGIKAVWNTTQIVFKGLVLVINEGVQKINEGLALITFGDVSASFSENAKKIEQSNHEMRLSIGEDVADMAAAGQTIIDAWNGTSDAAEEVADQTKKVGNAAAEAATKTDTLSDAAAKAADEEKKQAEALKAAEAAARKLSEALDKAFAAIQSLSTSQGVVALKEQLKSAWKSGAISADEYDKKLEQLKAQQRQINASTVEMGETSLTTFAAMVQAADSATAAEALVNEQTERGRELRQQLEDSERKRTEATRESSEATSENTETLQENCEQQVETTKAQAESALAMRVYAQAAEALGVSLEDYFEIEKNVSARIKEIYGSRTFSVSEYIGIHSLLLQQSRAELVSNQRLQAQAEETAAAIEALNNGKSLAAFTLSAEQANQVFANMRTNIESTLTTLEREYADLQAEISGDAYKSREQQIRWEFEDRSRELEGQLQQAQLAGDEESITKLKQAIALNVRISSQKQRQLETEKEQAEQQRRQTEQQQKQDQIEQEQAKRQQEEEANRPLAQRLRDEVKKEIAAEQERAREEAIKADIRASLTGESRQKPITRTPSTPVVSDSTPIPAVTGASQTVTVRFQSPTGNSTLGSFSDVDRLLKILEESGASIA